MRPPTRIKLALRRLLTLMQIIDFNVTLSKFCDKRKIDLLGNANIDGGCPIFKKTHLYRREMPIYQTTWVTF